MFKVEFEKAYVSVDWKYLDEVMIQMNFPSVAEMDGRMYFNSNGVGFGE